jgi:hypothetical protein
MTTHRRLRFSFRIAKDQFAWLEREERASSTSKSHVLRTALHYASRWPDLAGYVEMYRSTTPPAPAQEMTTRSFTLDDANARLLADLVAVDGVPVDGIGRRSSVVRAILALCTTLHPSLFWGGSLTTRPAFEDQPQVAEITV